jgi:hypothetical protein
VILGLVIVFLVVDWIMKYRFRAMKYVKQMRGDQNADE